MRNKMVCRVEIPRAP